VTRSTPTVQELDRLEAKICRGLEAFPLRNKLIADLVAEGWTQAELTRRLNQTRIRLGAPQLTPDAIAATLKRQPTKERNPI